MAYENTVLSLNLQGRELQRYETALRKNNFHLIPVSTPLQARFEIEMGRCGVFLNSYITPLAIYRDLAALFKVSCPDGVIVYIKQNPDDTHPDADLVFVNGDDPETLVQGLRGRAAKAG